MSLEGEDKGTSRSAKNIGQDSWRGSVPTSAPGNQSLLVVLVDLSTSMLEGYNGGGFEHLRNLRKGETPRKFDVANVAILNALHDVINRQCRRHNNQTGKEEIKYYFDIGFFGFTGDFFGPAQIKPFMNPSEETETSERNSPFVSNPDFYRELVAIPGPGDGRHAAYQIGKTPRSLPEFNATPLCSALRILKKGIQDDWISSPARPKHREAPAPLVIVLTDGAATDALPQGARTQSGIEWEGWNPDTLIEAAKDLKSLQTFPGGQPENLQLWCFHLSATPSGRGTYYPSDSSFVSNVPEDYSEGPSTRQLAKTLFEMSTTLSKVQIMRGANALRTRRGVELADGRSRGYVFNGDANDLYDLLAIGSAVQAEAAQKLGGQRGS